MASPCRPDAQARSLDHSWLLSSSFPTFKKSVCHFIYIQVKSWIWLLLRVATTVIQGRCSSAFAWSTETSPILVSLLPNWPHIIYLSHSSQTEISTKRAGSLIFSFMCFPFQPESRAPAPSFIVIGHSDLFFCTLNTQACSVTVLLYLLFCVWSSFAPELQSLSLSHSGLNSDMTLSEAFPDHTSYCHILTE